MYTHYKKPNSTLRFDKGQKVNEYLCVGNHPAVNYEVCIWEM